MTIRNMAYMNSAYRNLSVNNTQAARSLQKLSSGYRVNSSADDAAGLGVSERMRGQIGGLSQASMNAQNGISMIQTAEGGLDNTSSILGRMQELAVQASNGTYDDSQRALLNREFSSLKSELDRVASSQNYNGTKLLDGSLGGKTGQAGVTEMGVSSILAGSGNTLTGDAKFSMSREDGVLSVTLQIGDQTVRNEITNLTDTSTTFQLEGGNFITMNFSGGAADLKEGVIANAGISAGSTQAKLSGAVSATADSQLVFQIGGGGGADQRIGLNIKDMSTVGLGISDLDISTLESANGALGSLKQAVNQVNGQRAVLGSAQNRMEYTLGNLGVSIENTAKSESAIRDADIASEMMRYTQKNMMAQASQAMMAQSMNLARDSVMSLLMR